MDIEFDEAKDAVNVAKHGVALALAADLFEAFVHEIADTRRDYGEDRRIAFGLIAGRLFVCVYTVRGNTRRIISLRRANRKERVSADR